jgi:small subunit ribosomal protein S17
MADENETPEVEETPEETPASDAAPDGDQTAEAPAEDAPTEEPVAEEPVAEEAPAEEALADDAATEAPEADAPPEDEGEKPAPLTKKEQRTAARHAEASKRKPRTAEERAADRIEERKRKAAQRRRRREKVKTARAERTDKGPAKTASTAEHGPGRPKVRQGLVVSDKADKTITVRVDTARRHRRYEKIVRSSSTLHAHDEANDAHTGDLVRIVESRPLSRLKRWRLIEVLERAK